MLALTGLNTVAPLVGLVAGAALQYIFGRTLEARKQLALQRGQAYADYFRSMSASATLGVTKETLSLATDAKTRICIYGSPNVVRRLADFERAGAVVAPGEGHAAVIGLLKAMRKDVGVDGAPIGDDDLRHAVFGPSI